MVGCRGYQRQGLSFTATTAKLWRVGLAEPGLWVESKRLL